MPSWRPIRSAAVLALLHIAASVLPARAAEPIGGMPFAGEEGIQETIAEIMNRELTMPRIDEPTDQEAELTQPDRTHLPQNPLAPKVSSVPEMPAGFGANDGGPGLFAPQTIGTNFTGATLAGTNATLSFPPDCMGAVGPTQYFMFVNGRLVTFNKATGVADGVINADPDVFFTSVINGSSTSDPRIRYDRLTGRWFLVIINVSTPNRILIAVSDAASNGTLTLGSSFTFFFINIATAPPSISNTCFADYPTLGIDNNALYIGTNNFCGSPTQTFNSCDGFVIRKSSILGAGPIVTPVFRGLVASSAAAGPYTPQGVDNYDPSATEGYFIGVDNATFSTLMFRRVSTPGGTPTISGNISITTPTTTFPENVPHLGNTGGTNGRLSALDDRLFAAHIRNQQLWTAHNIEVNASGVASTTGSRDAARWYHLNVPVGSGTPTIVQSGTVFDNAATNPNYFWIPSILPSGQGHVAMGLSRAGNASRADAATVGRLSGDAGGTMQAPALVTASSTAYNPPSDPGGTGGRRWGDYSYVSLDPIDDMTMWQVQMFCDAANSYGVRITRLIAPPPATPSALADITAGANPVNVTLTGLQVSGSGFYDPGANLPGGVPGFNHLTATITNGTATGTPPTVVSATYVSPTSVNLVLNASAATASIGAERYRLTITNPDGQTAFGDVVKVVGGTPTVSIATGPTTNEGNAGLTNFNFTVNLSATTPNPVTVNYQTSDGTATVADNDYVAANSSIIIPANSPSGTITISVKGDTRFEPNETFGVTLTGATNATLGSPVLATGTIQNDDAVPVISIGNALVAEGNAGMTVLSFPVTLSNPSASIVSATFQTADGTALISDGDYSSNMGSVSFPANSTADTIDVNVTADTRFEDDETLTVTLSAPVNGTLGTPVGTGTIQNDDSVPTISIDDVSLNEGDAGATIFQFTATLSAISGKTASASYTTTEGTATLANNDFDASSGPLSFPPGTVSIPVMIQVNGDVTLESNETFTVDITPLTNVAAGDVSGAGDILNDDDVPFLEVDSVSHLETDAGAVVYRFTVSLSNATDQPVSVQWNTADGSATTADNDYVSNGGTLNFPPKVLTQTFDVFANGDVCGENDEVFDVVLSSPVNAAIGTGTGAGTIQNDDENVDPSVTVGFPNGAEILQVGTQVTIQWNASDNVGVTGVDIRLSRDSGATFPEYLATNIPNTGSFLWTVTGPGSLVPEEYLMVVAHDAHFNDGNDISDNAFQIVAPTSSVPGLGAVASFAIASVRPNPTRGATSIEFAVPREGRVRISIVDLQGREVAVLQDNTLSTGRYQTNWDGTTSRGPAPMGVYFVRAEGNGTVVTERFVVAR
ncbi:MAG TPA: Calx-beta domain-containing protein [Candidatus Eisenbacteria bacterium]